MSDNDDWLVLDENAKDWLVLDENAKSWTLTTEGFGKAQSIGTLVLQSVFVPGGTTDEGRIVRAVAAPWRRIVDHLLQNRDSMYEIPARVWEEIVATAYKEAGFDEVILTPRSRDFGRDVIATKRGLGTVRVIDQVKAYRPGHVVTADDVRAILGVLHLDGASKGFVTTTSDFAPRLLDDPLIEPLIPSRVELINGTQLLARLKELRSQ